MNIRRRLAALEDSTRGVDFKALSDDELRTAIDANVRPDFSGASDDQLSALFEFISRNSSRIGVTA